MAQSAIEEEILQLSTEKFRWKTEGSIDRVADLFDDELVFVHITGQLTTKADWIRQLKTGQFVYNKILAVPGVLTRHLIHLSQRH